MKKRNAWDQGLNDKQKLKILRLEERLYKEGHPYTIVEAMLNDEIEDMRHDNNYRKPKIWIASAAIGLAVGIAAGYFISNCDSLNSFKLEKNEQNLPRKYPSYMHKSPQGGDSLYGGDPLYGME